MPKHNIKSGFINHCQICGNKDIKNVLDLDPTGFATKNYNRWLSLQDEVISKFTKEDKDTEYETQEKDS